MEKRKNKGILIILLICLFSSIFSLYSYAETSLVSLSVRNANIEDVLMMLTEQSGINLVPDKELKGKVTLNLKGVKIQEALQALTKAYNYQFKKMTDNTYLVSQFDNDKLNIWVIDGKVTMEAKDANLGDILASISQISKVNMVLFGPIREQINLKLDDIPIEDAINLILAGGRYTYIRKGDVFLVGEKNINSPASSLLTASELIPLEYLQAEKILKVLPSNIPASNVKVINEQNAIMVTGTQSEIEKVKEYIAKIDQKIPQIVVEALIIDISHQKGDTSSLSLSSQLEGDSESITLFDNDLGKLSYKSIIDFSDNFRLNLQSLISNGKATIRANPNITTLNGQQATIEVSDVTYYEVINTDEDGNEETKYQSIDAGITLDVTPWVSNSGSITLELKPSISNMKAQYQSRPPDIGRREISTTVRVKDGQTIVLGGLLQDNGSKTVNKVPILGDIPLLGRLFRSKSDNSSKTELLIYITPHILKDNDNKDASKSMEDMIKKADEVVN
jgi:type IV pilus assembly protein PilQ